MSDQKPKSTIRQMLEMGPTDPILMEKLSLLEELQAAHAKGDQRTMLEIGRKLAVNEKDFEAGKKRRRANMASAAAEAKAVADPEERVKTLLSAFAFCAKETCAAREEGQGMDTYNFGVRQLCAISAELEAMDRFPALAAFLDHSDVGVRGFAAVWLRNLWPERILPILKEINKTEKFGSPVGTQVFTAIFELEQAQRKESGAKP